VIDWAAAHGETVSHLQRLIRFDTSNPPGNELPAAQYLAEVLSAAGVAARVFEPAPGRGAVVARLAGTGAKRPVLLLAHMDVVAALPAEWSVDPFAGVVRDGYVYGRGAIDDKGMLAVNLMVMLLFARAAESGERLARDVVFVATADEETGGPWGIEWLLDNCPELLDAEFALNEGGRVRMSGGRPVYIAVQTAEKVPSRVLLTARGTGGHASVPLAENPVARLGRALAVMHPQIEPPRILPVTRKFFGDLAAVSPDPRLRAAMEDIASPDLSRRRGAVRVLSDVPAFNAIFRAGISPTMIAAGTAPNVIPAEASATLNIRTLPGQPLEEVLHRLERRIADPQVELTVLSRGNDAPQSSFDSPLFEALAHSARALVSDLAVVPYLSTGATDSAQLRRRGVPCYGVLPFPLEPADEQRMHGADERVPLAALDFGVRFVHGALERVGR
jgi:acetylornithine deacetylase/succinyl-diaminopimelate desuccinylase-like protein